MKTSHADRLSFNSHLLMGVASFALLMSAVPAYAQDQADAEIVEVEEEDVVVTTGIRRSIQDSLELKRDNGSIIEAITAEDIGKLPDVSIADSLARLPGVTAQRVRGRAQSISIRGLGPQFSLALLNGREVVSTSGNRGVEFDQFPSELIGSGVVYKTSDARLAATGIGGAVDLRTRKPLDTEEGFVASGRYVINGNGDLNPDFSAEGYRLFGSGTFRNDNDTFGLTLGITHQSNPTQIFQRDLKTQGTELVPGTNTAFPVDNPRSGVESRDFERTSVAGTLQFDPAADISFTFDGFYSDFDDTGIFRGVETPLASSWAGAELAGTTGTGGFVDSATYDNVGIVLRTDTQGNQAEIYALGGNVEFGIGDKTRIMFDVGYSSVSSSGIDYESYAGVGNAVLGSNSGDRSLRDTFTFTTPSNGAYSIQSGRDYTDGSSLLLTDPGGWGQVGFIRNNDVDDELAQIRAEITHDLDIPFIDGLVLGVLQTGRNKSTSDIPAALRTGAGFTNNTAPIPNIIGRTDSGSIGLDIVAYDPSNLINNGTYLRDQFAITTVDIEEDITTLYAMLDLGEEGSRLRGNLGLQFVQTDQESTGQFGSFANNPGTAATLGDTYDHWLPTLNLSYDATDDLVLRFGAGRAISRAQINDLSANLGVSSSAIVCPDTNGDGQPDSFSNVDASTNNTCLSFGGGNPFLRPFETTYGDVSAEYYFSPAGAISIAGFVKDIQDYVQGSNTIINNSILASQFLGGDFVSANPDAAFINVGGPANVGTGSLAGFEVAVRLPLEDFIDNEFLSGFGVNGAFTYSDASVEFDGNNVDIPGYSSETASGEIYYEKNGFRARLNARYRSGFQAEILQFNGQNIGARALSETILDAQIGYDFDDRFGKLVEGTTIAFEVYNLTDEPFRTTNTTASGEDFVRRREDYGVSYNFILSKKF